MNGPIYTEQPAIDGLFEPVNTLTNLFFIAAGIYLLVWLGKRKQLDQKGAYLSSVLILIGIGSFAWHFYRANTTLMMDSIPIGVFVLSYLFFYLKHVQKRMLWVIVLFIGFFVYTPVFTYLLMTFLEHVFGSGGAEYFAAISYFMVLQIINSVNNVSVIKKSMIIAGVFCLSLFFRQIDLHAAGIISFGTHFLRHTLNALTLFLMVRLLYTTERVQGE